MSECAKAQAGADRNLLFAVLALQLDFLSQNALIGGLNAWVLDKAKPLGDILVQRGALRRDAQAVLEALVEKHLEMHDGAIDKSLTSIRALEPLRLDVRQITDPELQATLSGPDQESPSTVAPAPGSESPAVGKPTSAGQRFRILRPHARGGLGEVFLAQDEELQREVALKEIQGRWANDAPSRARFLLEAAITGGLEHPGIVPVYGLGAYPDGRPYYAMRFIKGDSLQTALRRFHDADQGKPEPGQRILELRQLLGRFVAVCNAVAYAHSRGVLHRDLKPANVMLGPYGETLVVDWGLAKTVGRPEGAHDQAEKTLQPKSASDSAPTQAGAVLGTPPYMSPEQAAGRLDQLGPASDVYSLGATLYVLLTGKAPFEGNNVGTILQRVQRGDFLPPRQVQGSVPAALEAVCLKAMALKPEDRYPSARTLAEEVERWLADEPVSAWREPWRVRAGRWVRRHRAAVTGGVAAVAVAALCLAVATVLLTAANQREREANEALSRERNEARRLEIVARKSALAENAARQNAQANETLAAEQRNLALQTLRTVIDDIHAQLKNKPALQELRQQLLDKALAGLKKVARSADNSRGIDHATIWVHFEMGDLFLTFAGAGVEEARKQYALAHDLAKQRAAADPKDSQAQRDLAISYNKMGDVSLQLGQVAQAREFFQQGLDLTRQRAAADSKDSQAQHDLSVSYDRMGNVSLQLGQVAQAKEFYQRDLDLRKQGAAADPKDSQARRGLVVSYHHMGDVSLRLGQAAEAKGFFQQGLDLSKQRAAANPKDSQALRDLFLSCERMGDVSLQLGQAAEAKDFYQQCLDLGKQHAAADPKDSQAQRELSNAYNRMGDISLRLGQVAEAKGFYQQDLELSKQRAAADAKDSQAQRDLSISYERMGNISLQLGQVAEAKEFYQQGLELNKQRAAANPKDSQAQRGLSVSYNKMGDLSLRLGQVAQAREFYQQGLDLRRQRAAADPKDSQAQRDLAVSYNNMGDVSLQLGQVAEAKEFYQQSLDLGKQRAAADLKDSQALRDLAIGYDKMADVSLRLGQLAQAKGFYQQSLDLSKQRAAADPKDFQALTDLAISQFSLGKVAQEQPDHYAARLSYEAALDVLEPWRKAGRLKGTPYASWPGRLERQIAFCRLVDATLRDVNVAFKQPPPTTRQLLMLRAKELARQHDLTEAAASAERLAALKDPLGEALFCAARAHGYIAGVAGARADSHVARALELLQQAHGRGILDLPANRDLLKSSRDFEALRKHADFVKLQADLAQDTGRVIDQKEGQLRGTDPPDRMLPKSPHQVHTLKLTAGKRYAIALDRAAGAGTFDPFLRLEDAAGKELARDDDAGGTLNALVVFRPEQTASYRIIVTSFDGSTGSYVLTVWERP